MKKKHEDHFIESHEEKLNKLSTTIYLSSCLDELNQEFELILDINIMTQLKYSISKF